MRKIILGALALVVVACGTDKGPDDEYTKVVQEVGSVKVTVKTAAAWSGDISSVTVTSMPDAVTQAMAYDSTAGTFTGMMLLSPGDKTLTGRAYVGAFQVGEGSAPVTITANQTSSVLLFIFDTTGPQPENDIAPIIQSVFVSNINPITNEPVTVSVNAVDLNGDALTYAWSDDCTSATFAVPSAATTTWSNSAPTVCNLTITVSSTVYSVSQTLTIVTFDGSGSLGSVNISGEFIPNPISWTIQLAPSPQYPGCVFEFTDSNFVCLPYPLGATLPVTGGAAAYFGTPVGIPTRDIIMTDDCGGSFAMGPIDNQPDYSVRNFIWYPPAAGSRTVCELTAEAWNLGMSSSFSIAILRE